MLCRVSEDDDEEWGSSIDRSPFGCAETDNEAWVAGSALERLSENLGGAAVVPRLMPHISSMLNSNRWQEKWAGTMGLAVCCASPMWSSISSIFDVLLPLLEQSQPEGSPGERAQIAMGGPKPGESFQVVHGKRVLSILAKVLDIKESTSRVQAEAAYTLCVFCTAQQALPVGAVQIISSVAPRVLSALHDLLRMSSCIAAQQYAITAVASIAQVLGEDFGHFYSTFMPLMKFVLKGATGKEQRLLRGKAMECVGILGSCVGAEVCTFSSFISNLFFFHTKFCT
eukprot:GSMAST32.ASY1.ANO1.1504.1 assembled CDS